VTVPPQYARSFAERLDDQPEDVALRLAAENDIEMRVARQQLQAVAAGSDPASDSSR
jgi:hypothetical protein